MAISPVPMTVLNVPELKLGIAFFLNKNEKFNALLFIRIFKNITVRYDGCKTGYQVSILNFPLAVIIKLYSSIKPIKLYSKTSITFCNKHQYVLDSHRQDGNKI